MAFINGSDSSSQFLAVLQNDFKNLSLETRKKYPQIKEACDEAIDKLTLASSNSQNSNLYAVVNQILYPLVQGCESKDIKIIKFCLGTIQRLIAHKGIDTKGARHIVDCLNNLSTTCMMELKLLQTAALLMTTSDLVHGETLAKTLVLCMRIVAVSEGREPSTCHAAEATVRQLVALVFERALAELTDDVNSESRPPHSSSVKAPKDLQPCTSDAYLVFQDIIQLINGDQANWLQGITDIPKTFGLELLDTLLSDFSDIFYQIKEFGFLLKEHVCALVIRLFSPNVKYRAVFTSPNIPGAISANQSLTSHQADPSSPTAGTERPHFPISMRLLRLVAVIIHKYHSILVTECEIFLSLTIKFLDPDKPMWQRALALEVLHKITIKPKLLISFCECYDLKPHATNIFQDIVNSLAAYVQSLFVSNNVNILAGGNNIPQQNGFYWKGVWLPLCVTFEPGTAKSVYLEMLDRSEAPTIQEGYGISVAYACLMELVRSLALIVEGPQYFTIEADEEQIDSSNVIGNKMEQAECPIAATIIESKSDQNLSSSYNIDRVDGKTLSFQLIKSSWCGLVWGLSVLAEASMGELDNILRAIQTLARISGKCGEGVVRDACVTALCRAALPAACWSAALGPAHRATAVPDADSRHQVLAVGTPLPSATTPAGGTQSWVMVTSRHVCGMKRLLLLARRDATSVDTAWPQLLTALQHLVWILGLKPTTGGSMKPTRASIDGNTVMSTSAVMADLPMLSSLLSKVFESSKNLEDEALNYLIDALCKLSNEAMELAYSNREPSLFAVTKLLETGLANLHRMDVMWRPITSHLLEVCQHPHIRMREWGVEAVTYLVQSALQYLHDHPEISNERLQRNAVEPLCELSSAGIRYGDVRARQLDTLCRLLHTRAHTLSHAWPPLINIIAAISSAHSPQLIASAFECAQLVGGELLSAAGPRCLRRFLSAVATFAQQSHDLNISLTAVGLMWNISDYLYHNQDKLSTALAEESTVFPELPQHSHLSNFEKLWMCLYMNLGALCTESRAPVRRAAAQTLFSCIQAHAGMLQSSAWHVLMHHVLYPMLLQVQTLSNIASTEQMEDREQILIHHTRNTAQKQWAETQVLTLAGVCRVFHTRFQLLSTISDFNKSWNTLMQFVMDFAFTKNEEVSVAAMKAFQEVLSAANKSEGEFNKHIWDCAWSTWTKISKGCTKRSQTIAPECGISLNFLTLIVQIFPIIFQNIKSSISEGDVLDVGTYVSFACIAAKNAKVHAPSPSPHHHARHVADLLCREATIRSELCDATITALGYMSKCRECRVNTLRAALELYRASLQSKTSSPGELNNLLMVLKDGVLWAENDLVDVKDDSEAASISNPNEITNLLLQLLEVALPQASLSPDDHKQFWDHLPNVLETFMFQAPHATNGASSVARSCARIVRCEDGGVPQHTITAVANLLSRGAMTSSTNQLATHTGDQRCLKEREEFAQSCLETFLQCSMIGNNIMSNGQDECYPLALTTLLARFKNVLSRFGCYDSTGVDRPSRRSVSEVMYVLKSIKTLAHTIKEASKGKISSDACEGLIDIYPELVGCIGYPECFYDQELNKALREALMLYHHLIKAQPEV